MNTKTISVLSLCLILTGSAKAEVTIGGHQYVDLGLSSGVLWATCNLGADTPSDYGNYYAWGETSTKSEYDYSSYWLDGKPRHTSDKYKVGGVTTLSLNNDAAHVEWGDSWRMPTGAEQQELIKECTWNWLAAGNTEYGVAGFKVVGKNGKHIFLPLAGEKVGSSAKHEGIYGNYWNSSLDASDSEKGQYCFMATASKGEVFSGPREYGQSIRPVSSAQNVLSMGMCGESAYYKIYGDLSMEIYGTGDIYDYSFSPSSENANVGTFAPARDNYWTQVKSVTIKEGITAIGKNAFRNCSNMESLRVASSVDYVEVAFNGCTSLTHLYLEDGEKSIKFCSEYLTESGVFFGDCPLSYLYLGRQLKQGTYRISGTQDDPDYYSFPGDHRIYAVYTPFCGISALSTVIIGDYVSELSNWCFAGCPIKSFIIGRNVETIGYGALNKCNTGESLVIPSNVKSLGCELNPSLSSLVFESKHVGFTYGTRGWGQLFGSYGSIPDLYFNDGPIPLSSDIMYNGKSQNVYVKGEIVSFFDNEYMSYFSVESFPFADLRIENLYVEGCTFAKGGLQYEARSYSSIDNIIGVSSTCENCFCWNNFKTVTFSNSIKTIEKNAFSVSQNLTNIELPEGLETIKDNAFSYCDKLNTVVLPSTITSIDQYAFAYNPNLESITVKRSPLAIDENVFEEVDKEKCTLYVPAGCKRLYQQAPVWKDFLHIVEYEKLYGDANMDGEVNVADVVSVINYLNDQEPDPFDANNADMNDKNGVNNADLKLLIEKIVAE